MLSLEIGETLEGRGKNAVERWREGVQVHLREVGVDIEDERRCLEME